MANRWRGPVPVLLFCVAAAWQVHAQVTLDGTLGAAGALAGPDYLIPPEVGRQVGGNLFHSFGRFGIATGESATFSGPASVANVVGRVTGGASSHIDGTLRSTIPRADLYLINPAGVVFGPNARLDVDGSFHTGTAHYLRLEDGGRFDAVAPGKSRLTAAPVAAFGFLDVPPASVVVDRSRLEVPEGKRISVVAGDVRITDGTLYAPAGAIDVAAVRGAGEVVPRADDLLVERAHASGEIETTHGGRERPEVAGNKLGNLDVSGEHGGSVRIRGGRILIRGGQVTADSWGAGDAQGLDLQARQEIRVQDGAVLSSSTHGAGRAGVVRVTTDGAMAVVNGGQVHSSTFAAGPAGTVSVAAGSLLVDEQGADAFTGIASETDTGSSGNAGRVVVAVADAMTLANGGQVHSSTFGEGDAGRVEVAAGRLSVAGESPTGPSGVFSSAESGSSGNAGSVDVRVYDGADIARGGQIHSDTAAAGDAGMVTLEAGHLRIDGNGSDSFTGISSQANQGFSGPAGDVRVDVAESLEIVAGGRISSDTYSRGAAGSVTVSAGSLVVDGEDSGWITGITSQTNEGARGSAGDVRVTVADSMEVLSGGIVSSDTYSSGRAGSVMVEAGGLSIDGRGSGYFTGISSDAVADTGNAGSVQVRVNGAMGILNGGEITSNTFSDGNAGSVAVEAERLVIDGQGTESYTGIFSKAGADAGGAAGGVRVAVREAAEILNGGEIGTSAFSGQNAGTVSVVAGRLTIDRQQAGSFTGIASTAGTTGDAGTVAVHVDSALEIFNGGEIRTGTEGQGNAGTVQVDADTIVIDRMSRNLPTRIVSNAERGSEGNAGSVHVTATGGLNILNGGEVGSSSFGKGDGGTVTVEAGDLLIDGRGSAATTGITGDTRGYQSGGHAGTVQVSVQGRMEILDGGQIRSNTSTEGAAGTVTVETGSLLIDARDSASNTGIFSRANSGSSGHAGSVQVSALETEILNGGAISSSTFALGDAGSVTVDTGRLVIDERGADAFTGVASNASTGSAGDAGEVRIHARESIELLNGGTVSSSTFALGDAGPVTVDAGRLLVDRQNSESPTGIFSQANSASAGHAGSVRVTAAAGMEIIGGGKISSDTLSTGNAGTVTVEAGSLTIDRRGAAWSTGIFSDAETGSSGHAGVVQVSVVDMLQVLNGGSISSGTRGPGEGGALTVQAGRLVVDRRDADAVTGIFSRAGYGSGGNAGSVQVTAEEVEILDGGTISSSTFAAGDAGTVTVETGYLKIDSSGSESTTGIFSQSNEELSGAAGAVRVAVQRAEILDGGVISSSTFGAGDAGSVTVDAARLRIDGRGSEKTTGVSSDAVQGSGNAGVVRVTVREAAEILAGEISSSTSTPGNAGDVTVVAGDLSVLAGGEITSATSAEGHGGNLAVVGLEQVTIGDGGTITAATSFAGNAGEIGIRAPLLYIDGGSVKSDTSSTGHAGGIRLETERFVLDHGGLVTSNTAWSGHGGNIRLTATDSARLAGGSSVSAATTLWTGDGGSIRIASPYVELTDTSSVSSSTWWSGRGGTVELDVGSLLLASGSFLSVDTHGSGQGGDIHIAATESVRIVGRNSNGANSGLSAGALGVVDDAGDGGTIRVETPVLGVEDGLVLSKTLGPGDAGSIRIDARRVLLQRAGQLSTDTLGAGRGGDIVIDAAEAVRIVGMRDGFPSAVFSNARSTASGEAGTIRISAPELDVRNGGWLSSFSEGEGNAGSILISAENAGITAGVVSTAATRATGGNIRIDAASTRVTRGGLVSASVFGDEHSDGGNVTIAGDNLAVLDGGRITATAAVGLGGRILVDTAVFLHDAVALGDVLDASSGTAGNDGTVDVNAPELDISGSLVALPGSFLDAGGELSHSCDVARAGRRSSLLVKGREAVSRAPDDPGPRKRWGCTPSPAH